ncbi:hypothetical protein [Tenacibaculum sp. 190524A02b]|uniref:hypothetical protein n=1 Tax=Tenacibaculum vairaonense TaxID=3137860 RepID=UPI0031FAAD35
MNTENNYAIFKKFPTLSEAKECENILNDNDIKTVLGDNIPPVDITFTGNNLQNQYEIRIHKNDFEKARKIMEHEAERFFEEINKDYYLFNFSNDELYDVLLKADEWNEFDYKLTQKILKERGKNIDPDLLISLRKERLKELAKPEESQKTWIYAGYLFTFLGGFLGIIIGYFLWTSKKTLPNGEKVFSYSEKDRKNGKYIFYMSCIVFPFLFVLRILLSM